jgi:hypothetical protein
LADLGLLYQVAETGGKRLRVAVLGDWKLHLATAQPDVADEFFRATLLPYWDWCSRQAFFAKGPGDNERFAFWELLPYAHSSFLEASRRAIQLRPQRHDTLGTFVGQIVKESALRYPDDLIELLIVLLDMETYPQSQQQQWQAAWNALKQAAGGKLDLLANELARKGISLDG